MKYSLKRFFTCISLLVICLFSNLGITNKPDFMKNSAIKNYDSSFILYSGNELMSQENNMMAYHTSHASHYSHYSSY